VTDLAWSAYLSKPESWLSGHKHSLMASVFGNTIKKSGACTFMIY
jgi:hypothetical protein